MCSSYGKYVSGLRFFRVLHLLRLSDMLRLTNIIQNQKWIQLVTATTFLLSAWSFGAGMFYLVSRLHLPYGLIESLSVQFLAPYSLITS